MHRGITLPVTAQRRGSEARASQTIFLAPCGCCLSSLHPPPLPSLLRALARSFHPRLALRRARSSHHCDWDAGRLKRGEAERAHREERRGEHTE